MSDPRLFFLHIPKTAGTTLAALLEQRFHADDAIPRRLFGKNALYVTADDLAGRLDEARAYPLVRGHYAGPLRERFFADYVGVTVLREPRARVVSLYHDWRTKSAENLAEAPPAERELARLAASLDLGRFLDSGHPLIGTLFTDAQARQLAGYLWDPAPPDAQAALDALERFDVVGTAEMLEPTVALLCRRLAWATPEAAPRLNASRAAPEQRLEPRVLARIEEMTQADRVVYARAQVLLSQRLARALAEPALPAARAPLSDRVDIDILGPIDGSGWHVREGLDTPRAWRWTGPEREATVALPLRPGRAYRVRVWVISVIAPDILEGVHLAAGGRSLPLHDRRAVEGQTVLGAHLPASLVDPTGPTRLQILVPRTMSHAQAQPGNDDTRQKGLAITRIAAEPA